MVGLLLWFSVFGQLFFVCFFVHPNSIEVKVKGQVGQRSVDVGQDEAAEGVR